MGVYGNALRYGYSNTRAKAMESKLIDEATMRSIADAKDVDSILSILFQTDYNSAIIKFGGLEISTALLDFAVSENMTERVNRLAEITPKSDRHVIRKIIARWDLSNVKLVLEAVDRKRKYEAISRYIISSSEFNQQRLSDAMREANGSVEDALKRLMRNRSYKRVLGNALAAYKKTGNALDAIAAMDSEHYKELGELALQLDERKEKAAFLLKMDIDMRNVITLLRAKRKRMKFEDVSKSMIKNGNTSIRSLASTYNSSDSIESFASNIRAFGLKDALEVYRSNGQMLSFEISMRNQMFNSSMKMLRASVLSLSTLIDYIYLKEIEVFTLRALIKSKEYGLTKDEISRLVVWNL